MFENIGEKIKSVAELTCILGIIVSVIVGIIILFNGGFLPGVLIAGVGALTSWVSSIFLYGFGELIENSSEIKEILKANSAVPVEKKVAPTYKPADAPKSGFAPNNLKSNEPEKKAFKWPD